MPRTRVAPRRTSAPLPRLTPVPAPQQWTRSTEGRIALDPSSWMQAVHWAVDHAELAGERTHGPRRLGRSTIRIAQVLAELKDCRPGIAYLVRTVKLKARTVKYHLGLLREAGLLAYRFKGTRVADVGSLASEFDRVIPPAYDEAVRLRTRASETHIRIVCGIEDEGRPLMRTLCRKAGRKLRAQRRPAPGEARNAAPSTGPRTTPRCTPRVGGSTQRFTDGLTLLPSESGQPTNPAKTATRTRARTLNAVGRRHQLSRELIEQVPWLARANPQRISWIVRHLADAGWSTIEVVAVLALCPPATTVHRPSGFLAHRLRGTHLLYDTPDKRNNVVTWWRDSRIAEQSRHTEWDTTWTPPTSRAVTREVNNALTGMHRAKPSMAEPALVLDSSGRADLDQLDPADVVALRLAAQQDHGLIRATITHSGEDYARRLFTNRLVDRATDFASRSLIRLHDRWGHA
ncbi:transcriptional regulator [Streptacidiphilus sp. EB103A]|uniref:transcriptional regulator n=1 Tax=Streptacidiphilus sp. EB103A TaxID=3156275 RepID=UPI0035151B88